MHAHRPGELLVVDGSSDFLSFAATSLHRRGHAVRVAAYSQEAREHLERNVFDAVICGFALADEAGLELCSWIKSHDDLQGLPVALVASEQAIKNAPPESMAWDGSVQTLNGPLAPDELILLPISGDEFATRVNSLLRLRRYREEIGNSITALLYVAEGLEEQNKRARGHCRRLSIMSVMLGAALGCDDYELLTLERVAYLHDLGKSRIPGAILDKTQPLTPRELEIIKEHPELGETLCRPIMALQATLPIIRHHHERGDGSGYPDRLRISEIPFLAQLFSVVDVFDSLRTWRPYRPALHEWQAKEVLRQEAERGLWNQEISELFLNDVVPRLDEQFIAAGVAWENSQT